MKSDVRIKREVDGSICVAPGLVGGSFAPGSDVIENTGGATYREMNVNTRDANGEQGGLRALFYRSSNRTDVEADVKWKIVRAVTLPGNDPHAVPEDIVTAINDSQWFRIEHLSGAPITSVEAY